MTSTLLRPGAKWQKRCQANANALGTAQQLKQRPLQMPLLGCPYETVPAIGMNLDNVAASFASANEPKFKLNQEHCMLKLQHCTTGV